MEIDFIWEWEFLEREFLFGGKFLFIRKVLIWRVFLFMGSFDLGRFLFGNRF